jgi:hypothetical protein
MIVMRRIRCDVIIALDGPGCLRRRRGCWQLGGKTMRPPIGIEKENAIRCVDMPRFVASTLDSYRPTELARKRDRLGT